MSGFRSSTAIAITLFQLIACAAYSKREDFDRAKKRASQGSEVARDIFEHLSEIPPELRADAIDASAARDSAEARDVLRKMLAAQALAEPASRQRIIHHIASFDDREAYPDVIRALREIPEILDNTSSAYLMKEKNRDAAALILGGVVAKRIPVTDRVLLYFGETKYAEAIDIIKRSIPNLPAASIQSLGMIDDPEADRLIFEAASEKANPNRELALKSLNSVSDTERAMSILIPIMRDNDAFKEITVISAVQGSGQFPQNGVFESMLKNLYVSDPREAVREASIEALATMLKRSERELRDEMLFPSGEYRMRISYLREDGTDDLSLFFRESDRILPVVPVPVPMKKKRTVKRRRNPASMSAGSYYSYLAGRLDRIFGEEISRRMIITLSNALISYSESNTEKAELIVRTYMRGYGIGESDARKRLGNGLREPGSIGILYRGFKREYAKPQLAIFAFSQFFSVQRWQTEILFDLARNGEI